MRNTHPLLKVEEEALKLYIEWLNEWGRRNPEPQWTFTWGQFFSEHWEETYHIADLSIGWYRLNVMSAGTGDDGGPAVLIIISDITEGEAHIEAIFQEFDTFISEIYNNQRGGLQLHE